MGMKNENRKIFLEFLIILPYTPLERASIHQKVKDNSEFKS
jgi:hypothetical protein